MRGLINRLLSISLKKKVLMGYIFMSILIFGIIGLIGINFFKAKARYDAMNAMSNDIQLITQLKADINGIRAAFLRMAIARDPDVWENQEGVIAFYSEKSDENLSKLKQGAYKDKIGEIEKTWVPFRETMLKELVPLVRSGRVSEAMNILGTVQAERSKAFMGVANEIIESSRKQFVQDTETINKEIKTTMTTVVIIIVAVFAVAFIFSFWFINRYVIGVLHGISLSAEKVAKGDLTVKVESETGDEFGKVANDVTGIIKAMRYVMRDVANKTVHILKDAASLTLYGKDVSQRVDRDLERTTTAATATEEMSSTIGDIARNINVASQAAENAMNVSLKGKGMINETVSSIDGVNTQIEMASDKVRDLAEFSKKIDEIVVMIKDIADQTNLLALNAAIEAARAGEQGRGFAVVADEVRKLAQRTTNATAEINNILSSIHNGTISATDMMDVAVEKIKATAAIARHLDESFAEIHNSFQRVADMVHQIVTATEEQSATVTEISTNLTNIAEDAKESSMAVKDMTASFNKFGADAKEFLKLLDGFYDPKMKIGVTKADYVLWLYRIMDLIDARDISMNIDELQADKSRMGKWLYGEGKEFFGNLGAFREIESPHKRLHELGFNAYKAAQSGDKEAVKKYIADSVKLIDEIISILTRLESEA
jgi:methyl-accepting chemotaxis protein